MGANISIIGAGENFLVRRIRPLVSQGTGVSWQVPDCGRRFLVLVLLMIGSGLAVPGFADACRALEPPSGLHHTLWVHLEDDCSLPERRELAVSGADLLAALEEGKNVDLHGVVVVGDVLLDHLSLHRVADLPNLPSVVQDALSQRHLDTIRFIPGSLRITASQFDHVFATNLSDGALVILGEVDFHQSEIVQSVDFSKVIFAEPVILAGMRVDFEAFFIGAQFLRAADFSQVVFGTHSRFHKAVFHDSVTFAGDRFKGVAEFLEVTFHGEAQLTNVSFESGAGFSGSVFHGPADFSDSTFTQEIYFRFTEFRNRIVFGGTDFHKVVDFSNAQFTQPADFSHASFAVRPESAGSNLILPDLSRTMWRSPAIQLSIAICLLLLVGLHYLRVGRKPETK